MQDDDEGNCSEYIFPAVIVNVNSAWTTVSLSRDHAKSLLVSRNSGLGIAVSMQLICPLCARWLGWCFQMGSAKDIRRHGRCGQDSMNALEVSDAVRSSLLSLMSSTPAKIELSHYSSTEQLLKCVKAIQ